MKKLNKRSLMEHVLHNGCIAIDSDGRCNFVVTQINDENFSDISPTFKQQLEDEGKYNSWIGFITLGGPPYSVQWLPIYGDSQRYVTKWFNSKAETAIEQNLNDNQMRLLKRANDYILNN